MKLKMYFALLAMGMIGLQSCSNDDDDDLPSSQVPELYAMRSTAASLTQLI